jgi:hypothetical protein
LCIDTIAWRLNFVVKCSIHFHEIWCWVKWWTFSICMWRTLGIFATQQPLMFLLMFWYWLQDFEGEKKWKWSQAKKVALHVSSSKLDFEAWEIWHQKVRLVKLFSSERHANGDILETLLHYQYSTYTLTCLNSLLSDQSMWSVLAWLVFTTISVLHKLDQDHAWLCVIFLTTSMWKH